MLTKCDGSRTREALDFIGADRAKCFYLYMDLEEYGPEQDFTGLWFLSDEQNQTQAVLFRYYDALHLFSRTACDVQQLLPLIRELDPKCINTSEENAAPLLALLGDGYEQELSHIITAEKLMEGESDLPVHPAGEADIPEIVELMMKEPIYYSVYTAEGLANQLHNRMADGFGRLFVMRDHDGRMVATNATSAETSELAVISGLVTDPAMRGRGLGRAITASTWNLIYREGKQGLAYLGAENDNTVRLHRAMGYTFLGVQARLLRR